MGEENASMIEANELIQEYNKGIIKYIVLYIYSPLCLLQYIKANKMKFIIHFETAASANYLRRCAIAKYESALHKIHCISLIDDDKIQREIESKCNKKSEPKINQKDVVNEWLNESVPQIKPKYDALQSEKAKKIQIYQTIGIPSQNKQNGKRKRHRPSQQYNHQRPEPPKRSQMKKTEPVKHALPKDVKSALNQCIENYFENGAVDEILKLNCRTFKIWGNVINDTFRDREQWQVYKFIDLMVVMFEHRVLHNKKEQEFNNVILQYLVIQSDLSAKKCRDYFKYIGYLLANLCFNNFLAPHECFSFWIKRYKEYSDEGKRGQKKNINVIIQYAVEELKRLNANARLIQKVKKFSKR